MKYNVWNKEDEEVLKKYWGEKPLSWIAKKLKRTEGSVLQKSKNLDLGGAYSHYLLGSEVARILSKDLRTIKKWISNNALPMREKVLVKSRKCWVIDINDLLKWLEANQDLFDASKIEMYSLTLEPEWLKQKRKDDIANKISRKSWNKEEDNYILSLYMRGYSIKEIAEKHPRRTMNSIQCRISRINRICA